MLRSGALPAVDSAWSVPADVVLALLGNEPDSFKDIRDVIYAALLDVEELNGVVEVQRLVGSFFQ